MGAPEPCPNCGGVPDRRWPLEALHEEIARIRVIAERQEAVRQEFAGQEFAGQEAERESQPETIARLTREVQALRETVAMLRGTTHRATARPQHMRAPARTPAA